MADTVHPETGESAPEFGKRIDMVPSISAFVLSGGYNRRFGTNKALYQYKRQLLIRCPLELLGTEFSAVYIVTKNPADYHWLGYPGVSDVLDQQTPLVGILSGLVNSKSDWNYFQACDMPFMQPGILGIFTNHLRELNRECQALLPRTDQSIQLLASFYHKNTIDSLREAIRQERPVKHWVGTLNQQTVNFGGAMSYQNVNSVEDLNVISA